MRDTKYIESRCFHTGVVPELIKQLTFNPVGHYFGYHSYAPLVYNAPIHRAHVVMEWFDEHENDVNHKP